MRLKVLENNFFAEVTCLPDFEFKKYYKSIYYDVIFFISLKWAGNKTWNFVMYHGSISKYFCDIFNLLISGAHEKTLLTQAHPYPLGCADKECYRWYDFHLIGTIAITSNVRHLYFQLGRPRCARRPSFFGPCPLYAPFTFWLLTFTFWLSLFYLPLPFQPFLCAT